jgi:ubiquinone/menaquinone biosynthesis C-methylase UbiE
LSFGCGDGAIEVELLNILLSENKQINLTCVEPNRYYVEQAWQSFRNGGLLEHEKVEVTILPTTIENFNNPGDMKYDLIILSHVLYYPEDKEEALLKTMRLLNTSGVVLVFQQAPGGLNEIQRVFRERANIPKRCIFNCHEVEQILTKHEVSYNYKTNIFNQYLDVSEVISSKANSTITDTTMALLSFICEQDFKNQVADKPELVPILNEMVDHINKVALLGDKPVLFYPTAVTTITSKHNPAQYRNIEHNTLTLKTATLGDLLQLQAETSPTKTFIKTINSTLSYQTTNFTVKGLAKHLRLMGIKKGSRVALISPNSQSAILIVLAAWRLGAVIVPLSTFLKPEEYLDQLNFVNASFLFVSSQWIDTHPSHSDDLLKKFHGHALILNDSNSDAHGNGVDVSSFITNEDVEYDHVDIVQPQDEAAILFSSGSTSTPKAIPFTHVGMIYSAESRTRVIRDVLDSENTVLAWLPLNHVMGLAVELVKTALYPGATYAVCPPLDLSLTNGQNLLNAISKTEANVVSVVPYILQQWMQISNSIEVLSKMRFILFGGAPIEESTIEYFNSRSVQLVQGYGSTEVGTICISRPKQSPLIFAKMPGIIKKRKFDVF